MTIRPECLVPTERLAAKRKECHTKANTTMNRERFDKKLIDRRRAARLQRWAHVRAYRKWGHVLENQAGLVPNSREGEGGGASSRCLGRVIGSYAGEVRTVGSQSLGAQGTHAPLRHVGASPRRPCLRQLSTPVGGNSYSTREATAANPIANECLVGASAVAAVTSGRATSFASYASN